MTPRSASELARALRLGQADPVTETEAVYDRIAAHGDAALFLRQTRARAMAEARASRERLRAGLAASPLDGVPLAWKDLFDLQGSVTTAGSVVLRSAAPALQDAAVVQAAHRAGMVTVGTVAMTEFAYSGIGLNPHYGTPRNPHDPVVHRAPGGSSSGSGVVVAAGIVPVSIGTDTGGSIRIPSSFNGVVGYKPSTGRHPMAGVFPLSPTLDTLGPIARTLEDCILTDAVLRARPRQAMPAPLADLDLMIPDAVMLDDLDGGVASAFAESCARLTAAGARLRQVSFAELTEAAAVMAHFAPLASVEASLVHEARLGTPQEAQIDARVIRRIRMADGMSAADLLRLLTHRKRLVAAAAARLGNGLLLSPTTPGTAMPIAPLEADTDAFFRHNARTLRNTALGNFLDWCALSLPNGADSDAMPTGLMICAAHGRDTALLSAGLTLEPLIRG